MTDLSWLVARSVEVIEGGQGPTGGYLASPTFPTYHYSWLRDGAFIADAMSRVDRADSAEGFFDWCGRVVTGHSEKIESLVAQARREGPATVGATEHLHTRYRLDGTEGTEPWENYQLDGYGTWLWALGAHVDRHGTEPQRWKEAISLTVDYVRAFWDQPSYDWWEEHPEQVHVSTLACLWAGLVAADRLGVEDDGTAQRVRNLIESRGLHSGHLVKWLDSEAVDASTLAAIEPLGMFEATSGIGAATIEAVRHELANGGVHRYLADTYYGGGSWVLLAGFLGLCQLAAGNRERAVELAEWMAAQADDEGHLPEQVPPLLHPDQLEEWNERWGPSARPLLWSHAMFITLATELGE